MKLANSKMKHPPLISGRLNKLQTDKFANPPSNEDSLCDLGRRERELGVEQAEELRGGAPPAILDHEHIHGRGAKHGVSSQRAREERVALGKDLLLAGPDGAVEALVRHELEHDAAQRPHVVGAAAPSCSLSKLRRQVVRRANLPVPVFCQESFLRKSPFARPAATL